MRILSVYWTSRYVCLLSAITHGNLVIWGKCLSLLCYSKWFIYNLIKTDFIFHVTEDIFNSNIAWLGVDIMGAVPFI